jgi:hypothetical protein
MGHVREVNGVTPLAPQPVLAPGLSSGEPCIRRSGGWGGGASRAAGRVGNSSAVAFGMTLLQEMDGVLPSAFETVVAPRLALGDPIVASRLGCCGGRLRRR